MNRPNRLSYQSASSCFGWGLCFVKHLCPHRSSEVYNEAAVFSWVAGSGPAVTEKQNTISTRLTVQEPDAQSTTPGSRRRPGRPKATSARISIVWRRAGAVQGTKAFVGRRPRITVRASSRCFREDERRPSERRARRAIKSCEARNPVADANGSRRSQAKGAALVARSPARSRLDWIEAWVSGGIYCHMTE